MAYLETHRTPAVAHRFFSAFSGAAGTIINWNDTRRTRNALAALSLHELDDIGLVPGDIDAISAK